MTRPDDPELFELYERQRAELERLRTLELVMHQMPATYWLVDHELRIISAGGPIEQLMGYPADESEARSTTSTEKTATPPGPSRRASVRSPARR